MKTEPSESSEATWSTVEVLQHSDEVTPFLPSLEETTDKATEVQPNVVIVLLDDYKIATTSPSSEKSPEQTTNDSSSSPKSKKSKRQDSHDFENMLYFVCNLCPYLCIKDSKITEHLENDHQTKTFTKTPQLKCPACPNIFSHKISLRSHLIHDHNVHKSDLRLIIQAVIYSSQKHSTVEEVIQTPIEKPPPPEPIVITVEADETDISNNDETVETEEIIEPKETKAKNIKCRITSCKVRMRASENMRYHLQCHQETSFACPECKQTFSFWKPLAGHLWRSHQINMELYSCDQCDYKCASLGRLNSLHRLIHSEQKNFQCEVCNKSFKNRQQLRNHQTTHKEKSTIAPYQCTQCSQVFFKRRQLRLHVNGVHEKLKPYQCSHCDYKVASRSALKSHMRQHTGEKPFTCDKCYYVTSDHNSLRRHKFRHTGEKPYKCTFCSYACIQSNTYKVHLKTKHPGLEKDLVFACTDCQYRTVSKNLYNVHRQVVHKEETI